MKCDVTKDILSLIETQIFFFKSNGYKKDAEMHQELLDALREQNFFAVVDDEVKTGDIK